MQMLKALASNVLPVFLLLPMMCSPCQAHAKEAHTVMQSISGKSFISVVHHLAADRGRRVYKTKYSSSQFLDEIFGEKGIKINANPFIFETNDYFAWKENIIVSFKSNGESLCKGWSLYLSPLEISALNGKSAKEIIGGEWSAISPMSLTIHAREAMLHLPEVMKMNYKIHDKICSREVKLSFDNDYFVSSITIVYGEG